MSNIFLKKKINKSSKFSKNILDKKNKNKIYNISNDVFSLIKKNKENIPSQKEWFNSIYSYNKNYIKNISPYDKIVYVLLKSLFYLHYVNYKETKNSRTKRIELKKLSINRILLSKAEILHTNKKAFFNLYIYNGEKRYIINQLLKLTNKSIGDKIIETKKKASRLNNLTKEIFKKLILKKTININKKKKTINKYPFLLKKYIKNSLLKEKLSNYYKYLLLINKSKFENTYIYPLYKLISKYYDKKIEFNIINLKYLHLNSSILSQYLVMKIKNRKNRYLNVLYRFLIQLKLPIIDNKFKYLFKNKNYSLSDIYTGLTNVNYKDSFTFLEKSKNLIENYKHDILNLLIQKKIQLKNENRKHLINRILKTIKHK